MKFQHKLAQEQRTNRPEAVKPGELLLLCYMILLAVHDASLVRKAGPTWIALNARDWLNADDGIDSIGSFAWVCHWLDANPETIRARCLAEAERLIQENSTRPEPTTLPVEERIPSEMRTEIENMLMERVFGQGNLFNAEPPAVASGAFVKEEAFA